jgi:transcriptional regulator with XRE-family HTH domain
MLDHLGQAARAARKEAGLRQIDIATTAGVSHVTISEFERGAGWPERLDAILDAYAAETGCEQIDLWVAALDDWLRG